ncbi:MAG TPA: nicotinate phosphoribosyltransferase [Myxococcaceae bacterium]|nr:nicotinate phosphoribosyltransferase [Myxococcaceae bacterium]
MGWIDDRSAPLLTDLYELTMAASYVAHGMTGPATFDLFVRALPPERNFLVVCGLEQALRYLERLQFDAQAIADVERLGIFDPRFLEYLSRLRFSGEVWAFEEGEIAFAGEPLLRVSAPLPEAQLVESFLLNCITFQTMIASKAARLTLACRGRPFADFSLRRDHGPTAALLAARAAYVGGASATSNVLASARFGIPPSGTMAHSFVMAFPREIDAFRQFARDFPDRAVLLIDTYDIVTGARRAAEVARELAARGGRLRGVRIDSGDLAAGARRVREILDAEGASDVEIFLSGDLDEIRIDEMLRQGVPADAFGVGTQLGTSGDAPSLGGVYKLAVDGGAPKMKLSHGKVTLPGRKQVYRFEDGGRFASDVIGLEDEQVPEGRPLLVKVMADGQRTRPADPREVLTAARERFHSALGRLAERYRSLTPAPPFPVEWSARLRELVEQTRSGLADEGAGT